MEWHAFYFQKILNHEEILPTGDFWEYLCTFLVVTNTQNLKINFLKYVPKAIKDEEINYRNQKNAILNRKY